MPVLSLPTSNVMFAWLDSPLIALFLFNFVIINVYVSRNVENYDFVDI